MGQWKRHGSETVSFAWHRWPRFRMQFFMILSSLWSSLGVEDSRVHLLKATGGPCPLIFSLCFFLDLFPVFFHFFSLCLFFSVCFLWLSLLTQKSGEAAAWRSDPNEYLQQERCHLRHQNNTTNECKLLYTTNTHWIQADISFYGGAISYWNHDLTWKSITSCSKEFF